MAMKKIQKQIQIIRSSAPGLSSLSQVSCDAIYDVLKRHYAVVGISIINDLTDLELLVSRQPDLVFMGMKFVPTNPALGLEDPDRIWISDYLDDHGIAYTGSAQVAHELELNKPVAKQRALDAGLNTSPFYVIGQYQLAASEPMPLAFPVFIKPTSRGGGVGIDSNSVVHNFEALESKVQSIALDLRSDSLLEEYLPGREFSVAILKDEDSPAFSVMPLELIAPADRDGNRILSAAVKSADTEHFIEVTDKTIKAKISTLAIEVFHALEARDYGRIDIRLDAFGTPHFLEANLIPSLIEGYGNFPKACLLNIGLDYEPMILSIVRLGLAHSSTLIEQEDETPLLDTIFTPTALVELV